ncbi:MAG: hypothetical protein Q8N99_06740, partial [Nanoarchaeota archaeon]|nr:hypothetical protein [Nanoarchaeota archaeon]
MGSRYYRVDTPCKNNRILHVRRNIEIFIKELEKRSEGLDSSEDDLIDELRCEIDVYRKYH